MACFDDGYMWGQEHNTYFPVAYHKDPVSFCGYQSYGVDTCNDASVFDDPKSIDYGYDNWYSCANPTVNYLAYNSYTESKLIGYEPTDYVSHNSVVYRSEVNSRFNEPDFEEYDPTPYGGGYDIISVYGKPLPPSDQTCYPRSKPKLNNNKPTPNTVSQLAEPKPKQVPVPVPVPEPEHEPIVTPIAAGPVAVHELDELELREGGERELEYTTAYPPNYGYEYDYPWPEYDHENARVMTTYDYPYGYGKQLQQAVRIPPNEYSPEVVDLCENIFGSWPCLARIRNQQRPPPEAAAAGQLNPWEECAARYIFGRPMPSSYN